MDRVEATLDELLKKVAASAERQADAGVVQDGLGQRGSLGSAIAEISRRQQNLERLRSGQTDQARPRATSLVSLQNDIAGLAARLESMQREQAVRAAAPAVCNLDKFGSEIAAMSDALHDVASRGSVATVEAAIRNLSQKIEDSRNGGVKDAELRPVEELVAELRQSLAEVDPRTTIKGLEGELKKLGTKIDDLGRTRIDPTAFGHIQVQTREIRDLLSAAISRPLPIERIERQMGELAQRFNEQQLTRAGAAAPQSDTHFAAIEARLEEIAAKVSESLNAARDRSHYHDLSDRIDSVHQGLSARIADVERTGAPDTRALEDMMRSLSDKIERATADRPDPGAIAALEQQIGALAEQVGQSNTAVSLNALERAVSELFGEFERTRTATLEMAEQTARNAVGAALAGGPDLAADHGRLSEEVGELRNRQTQADERTLSTLNAVHETLEKVVERMSAFESELNRQSDPPGESLASGPAPVFAAPGDPAPIQNPPPLTASRASDLSEDPEATSGGAADFLLEPGSGFPGRRETGNPGPTAPKAQLDMLDAGAARSDFIAAARRAAQAAQRETVAAAQTQPGPMLLAEGKPNILESTRGLIAHYRRPVVLSLAALFVAVGAYAVLKSLGHPATKVSSSAPPAAVAAVKPEAAPKPRVAALMTPAKVDDSLLSPNAMMPARATAGATARPVAGIDPIITGSIPHKAAARVQAKPRQLSFAELRSQARAGDARAQFALAVDYSEGHNRPRDLKAAAEWYAKAAARGLAPAQYRLATFYEKGMGVARNIAKAQGLYRKAAELGNVRAMHNLAVIAADGGESDRPDYAVAARWFKRAAEFGVRDSQYNYAVLLARGMGVPQDFVSSYVWFAVAAKQGDPDSASKRDDVGARLSPAQLAAAKAQVAAFHARTPSAAANDVTLPVISTNEPAASGAGQRPKVSML